MKANPECIGTIEFDAGVLLLIPVLSAEPATTLPPWKKMIK